MSQPFFHTLNFNGLDSDAAAFINAVGITDPIQKAAINTLVRSYKANGFWKRRKAIYPMIGGTAGSCKYNLKDSRDLDAAYRITWYNSPSFSAAGVTGNGTTQYGDTHLVPGIMGANNASLGFYSGTDKGAANCKGLIGCQNNSAAEICWLHVQGGIYSGGIGDASTLLPAYAQTHTNGWWYMSRTSSSLCTLYYGTSIVSNSTVNNTSGVSTQSLFILATSGGGAPTNYTTLTCQAAVIGEGFDQSEEAIEQAIWVTFQSTLGR